MPFSTVSDARERVPSLKNLSTDQVKVFISVFNDLEKDGVSESSAIPQAISAAKKVNKSNMDKEKFANALHDFVDKYFQGTNRPPEETVPIVKQFEDEKMEAIEWLYPLEKADLHGEQMDRETIEQMVESLNKANEEKRLKNAIDHVVETEGWYLEKAWINPCDCYIGEHFVPEGWPLAKTKFTNENLWKARKEGRLAGLSIGARGRTEETYD